MRIIREKMFAVGWEGKVGKAGMIVVIVVVMVVVIWMRMMLIGGGGEEEEDTSQKVGAGSHIILNDAAMLISQMNGDVENGASASECQTPAYPRAADVSNQPSGPPNQGL
jgi:hypothetical protein